MLCHETLLNYMTDTADLFFGPDDGYKLQFTYEDFENMLPWERAAYLKLIIKRVKEVEQIRKLNKKG